MFNEILCVFSFQLRHKQFVCFLFLIIFEKPLILTVNLMERKFLGNFQANTNQIALSERNLSSCWWKTYISLPTLDSLTFTLQQSLHPFHFNSFLDIFRLLPLPFPEVSKNQQPCFRKFLVIFPLKTRFSWVMSG